MLRLRALFLPVLLLLASLCSPAMAQSDGPLVLAAASLQEAMNAAADGWAAKGHPRPKISFAASSALARQIEAGAPADIFVSADEPWMDEVQGKGLIRNKTRVSFLTNSLVLVAPKGNAQNIAIKPGFPLARALGNGRLAVGDPAAVPAGIYAKQALTNLGVWDSVKDHLAPAENVRAALALVGRGVAPLGIVYATDARAEPAVRVAGVFPANSHAPISYPVAVLTASRHPDAEGFRRFLLSGEGKALFRRFGFGTK
ncbi:molybdate transport system substrate-binding protein [Novosphingobium sp. PhB165]|uniref:molybdate ABC transporter substrate-binding protein n=1 Tax=Novosphingobium sp. PhB165 TaxID=2485105 RepID=UPI0010429877|nr:molybdate ABC transporter substrate-binding protein [Novosphingobium sp. PhB165]TCM22332.1 molybdate transport system substrate-binding protein [Novosphingobium sp. PhB165]